MLRMAEDGSTEPRSDPGGRRQGVEITIGVQHMTRELVVDTDQSAATVAKAVAKALETGTPLELTDTRGRQVIIPAANLGYVEIGDETRKVGFHNL